MTGDVAGEFFSSGTLWGKFVAAHWHGANALQVGFVILGLPGLVLGTLGLFGRSGPSLPFRWWQRIAGVALIVLFNPGTVMAPFPGLELKGFGAGLDKARFGCEPTEISPLHHVTKGLPPTIIFHGKADTTVPYATAEAFARVMKAAGNRCDLVGYEGQPHGFFNHGRKDGKYPETLAAMDAFLVSLGWLAAK